MDGYTLNDILATKTPTTTKKKPAKRLWREIEEIQDRRQLLHELKELDPFFNGNLNDISLK